MPIKIKGENHYRTSEATRLAGISRSTVLRWLDKGIIKDESRGDRRGWRPFTEARIKKLREEANKRMITTVPMELFPGREGGSILGEKAHPKYLWGEPK